MDQDLYQKLLNASFRFVSYRPRSQKEISDFLIKKLKRWKTFSPYFLTKVLARLKELGYLDDEKFAAWWVEQRRSFRPSGRRLLEFELLKKGISKELINEVLNQSRIEGESEKEAAQKAVQKKLASWKKLPILAQKKKIYEFLLRRGFDTELVSSVIDELLSKE